MSAREMMATLTTQMRSLTAKNGKQPSSDAIKAANARCNTAGKYLSYIRLHFEWAAATGTKPGLDFLKLGNGKPEAKPIEA